MSPLKKKKLNIIRKRLDTLDNSLIKLIKKRTALVKNVLNWRPVRNLEDMCRDGWEWQRKH